MTQAPGTPGTNAVGALVRGLLDKGYQQATEASLRAIASSVSSGMVAQRLDELKAEAARLAEKGEPLKPDNPVLRALVADLETELKRDAARLDAGAADAQRVGVDAAQQITRALALPGVSDQQLITIGVQWNVPDPEAVNALVGYVNSSAWNAELARYPQYVLDIVRNQAIVGITQGYGPLTVAQSIIAMAQNVPVAQANTLMRTVQLVSYRDAAAIHQRANADILDYQIRIATLDDRTCMACIALHGTRLDVGERVDDHWNGRCTSISIVKGIPREVQSGEDWFNVLPEDRQRTIAGDSAFELMQSGRADLRDFVHTHQDPIFGQMIGEASVKGVLAGKGTP